MFVYLLKTTKLVKVGYTKDLDKRIKAYHTHNTDKVRAKYIYTFKHERARKIEALIHQLFKHKKAHGKELFHLDKRDIALIKRLCRMLEYERPTLWQRIKAVFNPKK